MRLRRHRSRPAEGVHARFIDRAATVRASSHRVVRLGVGVVLLAVLLVWLLLFSPLLSARTVHVDGVPAGSVDAIRQRAKVSIGQPLLRVDTAAIRRRLLSADGLASVTVSRSWPSTVVITASPRTPVLLAKNPQGQLQVVDASGKAYATVDRAPRGLPVVTVEAPRSAGGASAEGTSGAASSTGGLAAVLSALSALPPDLAPRVNRLTLTPPEEVSFSLGKVRVHWGSGDASTEKARVLAALLAQPKVRHDGPQIDVSAPESPVLSAP